MSVKKLESERLWLVPITLERCKQLLDDSKLRTRKASYDETKWPTQETLDILPMIYQTLKRTRKPTGFECWMIVLKENHTVIGDIGFHSHPDALGNVEIGYGLISSAQGKGYGFEALDLLMSWTKKQPTVNTIKAECLVHNYASIRLLQKVGMREVSRDDMTITWQYCLNKENK